MATELDEIDRGSILWLTAVAAVAATIAAIFAFSTLVADLANRSLQDSHDFPTAPPRRLLLRFRAAGEPAATKKEPKNSLAGGCE